MLQFITNESSTIDIEKQVQMVIEGGCHWIQLRIKNSSKEEVTGMAKKLQPICKDNECILVVEDWIEVAQELKLDGIHIDSLTTTADEARAKLGEEFIVGITASTFDDIEKIAKKDIDYISIGRFKEANSEKGASLGVQGYAQILGKCKLAGISNHIVAFGGITYDDISALMATGINGIAVSDAITSAKDPVAETKRMIDKLQTITDLRIG